MFIKLYAETAAGYREVKHLQNLPENPTGREIRPVRKPDRYLPENQTGTCPKTRPVGKSDQSENQAGTCPKTRQEPVRKLDHKRIRKEKSNVDEPSGYAFVLNGGKDYSLPKANERAIGKSFFAPIAPPTESPSSALSSRSSALIFL
ncbi:hypothetical protein [Sedimentisphaera salicampi]|uniref:hypothetical protein n=1 Tax=Sedimentisphaera salicampi TaxID=1941349 RepID=UPI000B9A1A1D|nr:hypothetical protein [Sedimentisphaera salicampi]OXU14620.1 hypothetical protein SMSP1_01625 [Sedimentisphaera salicampi]